MVKSIFDAVSGADRRGRGERNVCVRAADTPPHPPTHPQTHTHTQAVKTRENESTW